ncbi:MAG TPA: hypothetical protein VGD91_23690 [Trebonia sp.]
MSIDAEPSAPDSSLDPEEPRRPGKKWKAAVAGLVGAFVLLAGYDVISGAGHSGKASASAGSSASATASPSRVPASASAVAPTIATVGPSPVPGPLTVASVAAFGPDGTSDGDNPGGVSQIGSGTPWHTSWYATPDFGNLQSGTGLLLDLGHPVTVTSVQLKLGSIPGADVQVRVGDSAAPGALTSVASAKNTGGTVRLTAKSPAAGRYVLIWFFRLPPATTPGQYQVDVYDVSVKGTS